MTQSQHTTNLKDLLLKCMAQPDPLLYLLKALCTMLMEAEVSQKVGAEKSQRSDKRSGYRCGYRARRLDTRMGTIYLMVPKIRTGGYVPFFVTRYKRSEAALIQVVQEAFVQGVSTRKMEKLVKTLGIENLSRSQVSEMAKGLNEEVEAFRNRSLANLKYPVLWADALYEKVRVGGRVINMAVLVVCGVNEEGTREILAIEPMMEESEDSYLTLFRSLRERGLATPQLVISDAHVGLAAAIRKGFPGASWQRCKVHFMRNILAHVPQREKLLFSQQLKTIWQAPTKELAIKRAEEVMDTYGKRFPRAIQCLENGLEDSLSFYAFPQLDPRKISTTNMLERLNKEIRRRTRVVGIFPNPESYIRLVTAHLIEYAEDWSTAGVYMKSQSLQDLCRIPA